MNEEENKTEAEEVKVTEKPGIPENVIFDCNKLEEGFISGKITVSHDANTTAVYTYWGADGKKIPDYTFLSHTKAGEGETEVIYPEYLTVPEEAEQILVYAVNDAGESEPFIIDLPDETVVYVSGDANLRFQVLSDLHVHVERDNEFTRHFGMMLDDIKNVCPETDGIMVAGDIADNGAEDQYKEVRKMTDEAGMTELFHYVAGNHDNKDLCREFAGNPDDYYDIWVKGYHFIFIYGRDIDGMFRLPEEEAEWLKAKLAENADPGKPIFVFCHESLIDTVAGSMEDEKWFRYREESGLGKILAEYPQAVYFTGHSHWLLSSYNEMYKADERMCNAFNTSSVGYLWTGYNIVEGEYEFGSEGLFVEVYDDLVIVSGRDFEHGKWNGACRYAIMYDSPESADKKAEKEKKPAEKVVRMLKTKRGLFVAGVAAACAVTAGAMLFAKLLKKK